MKFIYVQQLGTAEAILVANKTRVGLSWFSVTPTLNGVFHGWRCFHHNQRQLDILYIFGGVKDKLSDHSRSPTKQCSYLAAETILTKLRSMP